MDRRLTRSIDPPSKLAPQQMQREFTARPLFPREVNNILSILFGLTAIAMLTAYSVKATAPYIIGENLVLAEIDLIFFKIKPMTLFTYLFFLSYGFGLSSSISKERFLRMDDQGFDALYVVAWFFVMVTGFEVMYHIVLWSAGLSVQGLQNPDIIVNWWPANPYAINVVFGAKLVVLLFAMSVFGVDYLRRLRTIRDSMHSTAVVA